MIRVYSMKTILLILALFVANTVFALEPQKESKDKPKQELLAMNNATLNMYALEITSNSSAQDGRGGILADSKIRIINLGKVINHKGVDYAPTVSVDGKTLYYVSDRQGSILNANEEPSHDFWYAKKADRYDTLFQAPVNLDPSNALGLGGVNTRLNEGAASLAGDKVTLYFTGCGRPDGLGSCDIYVTTIEGDKWGKPKNLGKNVNSKYFDSQPAITANQDRLYFVSTRPGPNSDGEQTEDNMDIWYSDYDFDTDDWKPAQNLTDINTKKTDVSPFIAADGVTLFFASAGHTPSFGGKDFYVTRMEDSKKFAKIENLGQPLNTPEDEQFITLPGSGDILYFSSARKDLSGAQGSYDIFMAFVPSFFKTITLFGTTKDECTEEFVPTKITIYNPHLKTYMYDSLTSEKMRFEKLITNDMFGSGKDTVGYINFEITAENPKYAKRTIVQRIDRPKVTKEQGEAGKSDSDINVTITLGQKPTLSKIVEQGEYIKTTSATQPSLANFDGLVMEEKISWDLYPLLGYVFFDKNSAKFPDRYNLFENYNEIGAFNDTTIAGGTLDKYYHVLNIYAYRLTKHPNAKITITGCNDNVTPEEKGNLELSQKRAQIVYDYFKNVWKIAEDRMTIKTTNFPNTKSNPNDTLGHEENRRVEILCEEWEVAKPVFQKDPKIQPEPEFMDFVMNNGIDESLITDRRIEVYRGNTLWKTLKPGNIADTKLNWNWKSEAGKYPKDEVPYTAQLIITSKNGKECKSEPINIPVKQVTSIIKLTSNLVDTMYENYSLILFKFNSFEAGPLNDKIMNDYVYDRCKPNSIIDVTGHTDIIGLYEVNKKLSVNRSNTVYKGIQGKTKGKYASLKTDGVGEDSPLYTNALPEGRFYNRTVQVLIKTPITGK